MMSLDEDAFLATFQRRRSVLGDISPSSLSLRGSPSHINLPFSHELCPSPSPDEEIIRQRTRSTHSARHRGLVKRHPTHDIENDTAFLQITPAKDPKFTQLSRKRLLMSPPRKTSTPRKCLSGVPAKRPRLSSPAPSLTPSLTVPLQSELTAFSTSQLVSTLDTLVNNHPELEQEIRSSLPAPDLGPLEDKLSYLKRNVLRAIPTVRFGSSRDAYCYRRAKLHLEDFKRTLLEQGKLLVLSQAWDAVVRYTLTAWRYVSQLPRWDETAHNNATTSCYQGLAALCMVGLRRGHLSRDSYRTYRKRIEKASLHSSEIEPCLQEIDKILESML